MKLLKRTGYVLLVILVGIQFKPSGNNQSAEVLSTDFMKMYKTPDNVAQLLFVSCYNCHSNNTIYPWYSKVQPVGSLLENHINKAKAELNLSDFGSYSTRRQKSKLKSMANQIEKGEMPLTSYTFIHREASLTQEGKTAIVDYLKALKDSL